MQINRAEDWERVSDFSFVWFREQNVKYQKLNGYMKATHVNDIKSSIYIYIHTYVHIYVLLYVYPMWAWQTTVFELGSSSIADGSINTSVKLFQYVK